MPKLKFYDVRTKKGFTTDKFRFETKKVRGKMRYFAIAMSSSGKPCWRIVSKEFYMKFK